MLFEEGILYSEDVHLLYSFMCLFLFPSILHTGLNLPLRSLSTSLE